MLAAAIAANTAGGRGRRCRRRSACRVPCGADARRASTPGYRRASRAAFVPARFVGSSLAARGRRDRSRAERDARRRARHAGVSPMPVDIAADRQHADVAVVERVGIDRCRDRPSGATWRPAEAERLHHEIAPDPRGYAAAREARDWACCRHCPPTRRRPDRSANPMNSASRLSCVVPVLP